MSDHLSHDGPRKCSQCGERKEASEFGAGDAYRCLACIRARVATWRLRRRQAKQGKAAGEQAEGRARRAVCGRTVRNAAAGGLGANGRSEEVRRLIADRERRARELAGQLRELEPERREAERRLAIAEGQLRGLRAEADEINRQIAALDRRLVETGGAEREYVRTDALADLLEPLIDRNGGIVAVATRTGVDRRALRGILDRERPLTTLRLADLICTRLGLDLSELEVLSRDAALSV